MAGKLPGVIVSACVFVLALAGCELGTKAIVQVKSDRDIHFSIPQDDAPHYCINSVEIRRYGDAKRLGNYEVSWRIRLKPGQSGPCDLAMDFPKVPPTFNAEVTSERLLPGYYLVVIDGGIGTASGEFDIPPRT
jgi:hypothetical protein